MVPNLSLPPRFAVDRMLGRLARWLRILGYDVAYGPHLRGRTLTWTARQEGRWLLTRDTALVRQCDLPPHLFITSDHFREQLAEVAAAIPLHAAALLGRCLDCNRPLSERPREAVREQVPPFVWETAPRFFEIGRAHV